MNVIEDVGVINNDQSSNDQFGKKIAMLQMLKKLSLHLKFLLILEFMRLIAVPAITGTVYAIIDVIKKIVRKNETFRNLLC